jgi:cell division protein FtsB
MERKYYNNILYGILAAVFIFFIAFRFFNISIQRQLEVQMYKKAEEAKIEELKATRAEELKEEKKIAEANALAPDTIKVQKQSVLLENQYYWDTNTEAILEGTDVIERMEEAGIFDGNKMTPEQYQQQVARIDGRIREYEQRVQADPGDDEAHQKLQSLYMLKASLGGLEETVVEK